MIDKARLRESALLQRQAISQDAYEQLNSSLADQLLNLIQSKNYQSIHFFLPIEKNNEPDFRKLFPVLWKEGRRIIVSKTHFKSKTLTHYWLEPSTMLVENSWCIPEPVDATQTSIENAELIVVPLLLADRSSHRIGYGGGFYDKLLADYHGNTVGVSLFPPIEKVPVEPWDIPLQKILFA